MSTETDLTSLEAKLKSQAIGYKAADLDLVLSFDQIKIASDDLYNNVHQYRKDWMYLFDAKVEAANIIWCCKCKSIKPADTAKCIYTRGKDTDGGRICEYIRACAECSEKMLTAGPWYGPYDELRKFQPSMESFEMYKQNHEWHANGESFGPNHTGFINSSLRDYHTGRSQPDYEVISVLANYVGMPETLSLTRKNPGHINFLEKEEVTAATA